MLIVLQGLERGLFSKIGNIAHSIGNIENWKLTKVRKPWIFRYKWRFIFWALLRQVILEKANGIAWEALAHQPRDLNNRKPQVKQTIVIIVVAFSHMRFFVKKNVTWRNVHLEEMGSRTRQRRWYYWITLLCVAWTGCEDIGAMRCVAFPSGWHVRKGRKLSVASC